MLYILLEQILGAPKVLSKFEINQQPVSCVAAVMRSIYLPLMAELL